jgi:biotin carboxylase
MSQAQGKRLLLISHHNSYRIAPYIKAAKNLGLVVTIASEGKHSLVSEVANGIHVDFSDTASTLDMILKENQNRPFSGILGSDDQTVELAAQAALSLNLPHNPPQAAQISSRKDLARAQLALAGCPVPINYLLDLTQPVEKQMTGLPWPCVLKPLNMSASRGVIRANDEAEFLLSCERLRPIVATASGEFEQHHLLIEEYIDGIEIAYEGYLHRGVLNTITIFDKPDPLVGPYFEETIYVTPSGLNDEFQRSIKDVIQKACNAYGLETGAVHAECRIDREYRIWILEIASRTIGGDCARILDNGVFGIEELAISLAMDEPLAVTRPSQARGVMMIPIRERGILRRVEGLLEANRVNHIDKIDIIIREGNELIPLPEGNQYLGYIFASADTPEQVTAAIRQAYALLTFVTAPVFKII